MSARSAMSGTAHHAREPALGLFEIRGRLDVTQLQSAVRVVLGRHAVLHGFMPVLEGRQEPDEVRSSWVSVPLIDLSGLPAAEQEEELSRLVLREVSQIFQPEPAPMTRISVVRKAAGTHVLLVAAHAAVADRESIDLFVAEVAEVCGRLAGGRPAGSTAPGLDFVTFRARQRKWLDSTEAARQWAYWRDQLGGLPPLSLPADRRRPAPGATSRVGRSAQWRVPARLLALWATISPEPDDLLLAAWLVVLGRYSGQRDIAVGRPVDNRPGPEWTRTIGPFENTLVLRVDSSDDPSFARLLGRVRLVREEALAHQQLPFDSVVEQLRSSASLSAAPLFLVRLVTEKPGHSTSPAGELHWRAMTTESSMTPFELTLRLLPEDGDLCVRLDFNTGLFEPATIETMMLHLRTVLEGAVVDSGLPLSALPMLTAPERRAVLQDWTDTGADWPSTACLHELVEAQVARSPGVLALIAGGVRLSYEELNARANVLAHRLRGIGVGPESRVGVLVDRTVHTVIAFLAVLKAGGAYVPMDPQHPAERLRWILDDAEIAVVLGAGRYLTRLPAGRRVHIGLDTPGPTGGPSGNPVLNTSAENLAYVIYTSGSTGTPKGVLVSHGNIVHATAARWLSGREAPGIYCLPVPFTFDGAAAGLYWTLTCGGRLVLPSDEIVNDPRRLGQLVNLECVTHFNEVPSQYEIVLSVCVRDLRSVRDLSVGGEVLAPNVVAQHRTMLPSAGLYNDYGPTEATVWSTMFDCRDGFDGPTVPIGRPIPNVRVYVLDGDQALLPIGVPGELHIAGPGLTRGYLNRPGLTAERFVPNPFGPPGDRLYRTGDLGRWLPGGTLEFLRRNDSQVKVRGFRIELGEVEVTLKTHPEVTAAVVVTRQAAPGDTRLAAYLTCVAEPPSRDELNAHLLRSLPHFMLPADYVVLKEFPVNSHGKVDRAALPAPAPATGGTSHARGAWPSRPIEPERGVEDLGDNEVDLLLENLMRRGTGTAVPRTGNTTEGESR
ncbi:non-ribosomal peptide synthetase [Amycolatopsis magusensis]|uniref:non-ribosomal peptide synthetase n=1 Tax=Amycolatopsis magusensis TaxID=882444 RepID=UPI0024A828D7|nr:amino acid adenylation domain-containing protein [Amycolatopsis magusensis]MDI5978872.1 amino acid adenylation domain-containing protein [Amycolatopsis magusensis]